MHEKDILQLKESIIIPSEMADTLLHNCSQPRRSYYRYSCYSRLCAALMSLLLITAAGSTSLAAYNTYQEKQLAVFIDHDLTQEEITAIGDELAKISDISSYRYVNGDQAWSEFKTAYFDDMPELAESFDKNPLADSNNYEVSIKLNANTQAVRDQISGIDGVRLITTIRDLKEAGGTMK